MTTKTPEYFQSATHAIELLQGKWRMQIILCMIRSGPVRLGQLSREIPSASKKVLTENLRELEASGMVVRRDLSGTVRHVEYALSEPLRPAIAALLDCLDHLGSAFLGRQSRELNTPPKRSTGNDGHGSRSRQS